MNFVSMWILVTATVVAIRHKASVYPSTEKMTKTGASGCMRGHKSAELIVAEDSKFLLLGEPAAAWRRQPSSSSQPCLQLRANRPGELAKAAWPPLQQPVYGEVDKVIQFSATAGQLQRTVLPLNIILADAD